MRLACAPCLPAVPLTLPAHLSPSLCGPRLQPVAETRKQQLRLWRELLVSWAQRSGLRSVAAADCALFENAAIGRRLAPDAVAAVLDDVVASGHGEWEGGGRSRCRILWRTKAQLADELLSHVRANGMLGTVYTVYELRAGDLTAGTAFHGLLAEEMLEVAHLVAARDGRAQVFPGDTADDAGVKFKG